MTRLSGACAMAAALCLAGAARPAAHPQSGQSSQSTVDAFILKNLEAKGGLAKLKAVDTIKQTGVLNMQGMDATLTIYSKRPNLLRQETNVNGRLVINAFDGQVAWILNPLMTSPQSGPPKPILVSGPQADMIREQSSFDGPLVDYKSQGFTVTFEGMDTVGDRNMVHLRLTSKSKQVSHLYLDSTTFLDVKLTTEVNQLKLEQEFSDYRDVDGIKWPFLIRTLTNGVVQSETRMQKVEFNTPMDEALFRVPKGL